LTLDTSVPGWHGAGTVTIDRLNLARWLNRDDRPSDISGTVTFDLALELGQHFPRGVYDFTGRHAMYMDYAADDVRARGQITKTEVLIAGASGIAYGAHVTADEGSIGIDAPFPYRFKGTTAGVDLRRVPKQVPVPHVQSVLAMDYDVSGRFSDAFIIGHAQFARSEFLGATIGAGTTGSIDTSQRPIQYAGEGDVENLDIRRFGEGLDVAWMRDPRYETTVAGRFRVEGTGSDAATMTLNGGGRLARAPVFEGLLSDADVSVEIADGTLRASYDGRFARIDPAIPFADPRYHASLTGTGRMTVVAHDLLTRTTTLADYDVTGALSLAGSEVRGFHVDRGELEATLRDSMLEVARAEMNGPELNGAAHGTLTLSDGGENDVTYDLTRVDLARVHSLTNLDVTGTLATKGRVTGPADALHAQGDASVTELDGFDVHALSVGGTYDAVVRPGGFTHATIHTDAHAAFVSAGGRSIEEARGTLTYDAGRLGFDVTVKQREGRTGTFTGTAVVDADAHAATIQDLTMALGSTPWRLAAQQPAPVVKWAPGTIAITPVEFVNGQTDQRFGISGTWRSDGTGALHVTAHDVALETLAGAFKAPTRYGGVLNGEATIRGTREHPIVESTVTVTNGRVERVTYRSLAGRINYADRNFQIDLRLDQSPGIWITAAGTVPIAFFTTDAPEQPVDVAIKSSGIDLALLEGLTNVVRSVRGTLVLDVRAVGTNRDPHFDGKVNITSAAFVVDASGVSYKNGSATLSLATDRITVDALHIEDSNGRPLDVRGSLGTHELRLGELEIEATARRFEVLRNEFGRIEVDASLRLRGRSEAPRVTGDVTVSGGELHVDEILQQTVFRPYATQPTAITEVDAVSALNPWNKLGVDVALHVPNNTLRLLGENVQVSPGAPIGIGDTNLRVVGDLFLYKDPDGPMFVNGSLDRVTGTFTFQGRRFDVNPASSINFRGDLNPEIYVTVTRVINGVEARVSIVGPLEQPELRMASTPPLDESDILSLIVFNTSTNQLTAGQQQELLVRAATLAAGFIATPVVSAIESDLGLDVFEIEPTGDFGRGPRVTIGDELAPGLVARFSRQFGQEPYDEATIEYYLSRLLRLRATFSDASSLSARSPFRRIERAGIDLLLFFSF
jgi:autotransporter translocation and assembly factor TamB